MQENKLIYAFQKNIVKNAKYTKYYEWFEFAERSLKKDNTEADFEKYNNNDVFLEMMHRLKAGTMTNEDADLIVLYNEFTHISVSWATKPMPTDLDGSLPLSRLGAVILPRNVPLRSQS